MTEATRAPLRGMLGMVLATAAYYALARVGLMLAVGQSNASAIWPPSGFGLALALLYGKRAWPCIFIGATLANITVFAQNDAAAPLAIVAVSLIIAAGNTIEAHAGAWLVQRLAGTDLRLPSVRSVYMFAVAIGTAAIAAALNGTVALWMGGIITTNLLARVAATWWIGDFLGMLVVGPIALSLLQVQWRQLPAPRISLLLLLAGTALVTGAIFYSGIDFYVSPYVLLLPVGWAAVRHGRGAVQATLAAIVGLAVVATAASDGPFDSGLLQHSLLDLCLFLAITTLISWLLAADTSALPRFSPIPLLALAVCMTLTVLTWEWAKGSIERDAQERFDRAADSAFNTLQGRMESYESLLRAGSALYESSDSVEHREWRSFVTGLELASQYPGVQRLPMAVALIDVDHFKRYNDSLGHQRGDECLQAVARTLEAATRRPGETVARYGGEEFVVLMPACSAVEADRYGHWIRERIAAINLPHPASPTANRITISAGIAAGVPDSSHDAASILALADQALYVAKNDGRDGHRLSTW